MWIALEERWGLGNELTTDEIEMCDVLRRVTKRALNEHRINLLLRGGEGVHIETHSEEEQAVDPKKK